MKRPWVYGKLVKVLLPLHMKNEVKPYSEELKLSRAEVRELFHYELDKLFDEAWPSNLSDN